MLSCITSIHVHLWKFKDCVWRFNSETKLHYISVFTFFSPFIQERISDLQSYVEALKQENAHLGGNTARSLDSTGSSGIRRVGRLTIVDKGG